MRVPDTTLSKVLLHYGRGEIHHGWRRLAERLGITPQAVRSWRYGVPPRHMKTVSKDTRIPFGVLLDSYLDLLVAARQSTAD